jgi:hypothetical protein
MKAKLEEALHKNNNYEEVEKENKERIKYL